MNHRIVVLILCLCALAGFARAADGIIELTTFPTRAVADGRSNITVSAKVMDGVGRLVADGTPVLFETTLGTFRELQVETLNGLARVVLQASEVPGIAKITASVPKLNAKSTIEFEFVSSRAQLSAANDYIEVLSPSYLVYSPDRKLIAAAGPKRSARMQYRDLLVEADDLQVKVRNYELVARKAKVTYLGNTFEADEVYYKLNERRGYAVGTFEIEEVQVQNYYPYFPAKKVKSTRYGVVAIESGKFKRSASPGNLFKMVDLSEALSLVGARRVVAYPQRELLFQRANIFVQGMKAFAVPFYKLSVFADVPAISDQFFNVTNNQLAVDYPHYLTLKPGSSSLLRFKFGNRYNTGTGAGGGAFLGYEMAWNQGDDSSGALTLNSLGRKDWGITARQYLRWSDMTQGTFTLDFPANSSLLGAANINQQLPGWQASLSVNLGTATRGQKFSSNQNYLTLERDPIRIGRLPLRLFNGFTLNNNSFRGQGVNSSQTTYGLRSRIQSDSLKVGKNARVYGSFSLSRLFGRNIGEGFAPTGQLTLNAQPSRNLFSTINYQYTGDRFSRQFLGQHRISTDLTYNRGKLSTSVFAARSLDISRFNANTTASYRFSPLWRFGAQYTLDEFPGSRFVDGYLFLGYTLGIREVGISWSRRTNRIGIEILGASLP